MPPGFAVSTVAQVPGPTAMVFAPDGRLFVASQRGTVHVIRDGTLLPTPFLRIAVDQQGERGLVGLALDPQFELNQWVYVTYTAPSPVHQRVSRFTADGDVAVPGSEQVIWDFNPVQNLIHVSGGTHFGPDGKLYVAHGDNNQRGMAQRLDNLLGKIIRITPSTTRRRRRSPPNTSAGTSSPTSVRAGSGRYQPGDTAVSDFGTTFGRIVDLKVSPDGDLYLSGRTGTNVPAPVQRITFVGPPLLG